MRVTLRLPVLALCLAVHTSPAMSDPRVPDDKQAQTDDRFFLTIYSAVWEGLFRDGVQKDVAQWIVCGGPAREDRLQNTFFVYGCPLCSPVREAFKQYVDHPDLSYKPPHNWTLGPGLPQDSVDRLHSPELKTRLAELQRLVQRWVGDRLEQMNLSPEERARWDAKFEAGRKDGMAHLQGNVREAQIKGEHTVFEEWTACPSCDGTNGACKLSGHAGAPMAVPTAPHAP